MALTPKQNLRSQDHNSLELTEVLKIQLLQDAANGDEAVRLSQAQTLSGDAAQNILITDPANASNTTAYTSLTMNTLLAAKQDNMSVDPSSTAFVQIIDGTKIKITRLTTNEVYVDDSSLDFNAALATGTHNSADASWTFGGIPIQRGDIVLLTAATSAQERSWVHNGGNAGDATDFSRLQTNYDETAIRAMFSAGDFISYDAASGIISVKHGLGATDLGAQTLPASTTGWQIIQPSQATTLAVLLALEQLIIDVDVSGADGTAALTARINALIGVLGSDMGTFTGTLYPDNEDVKDLFQTTEDLIQTNINDINAETLARQQGDATLQSALDSEINSRKAGDTALQNALDAEIVNRQQGDNTLQAAIESEANARTLADNALDARLDIVEGDDTTVGSIAKAEKDAKDYADGIVSNEASLRAAADVNLQTQIDALQSAFDYKGLVNDQGKIESADPTNPNNGLLFQNAAFQTGDFYKMNAAITIVFNGGSSIDVAIGDGLVATKDIPATSAVSADFQKFDNTESADIIREGMLDGITIQKSAGKVQVVPGSIGRTQLDATFVAEHDDKLSMTADDQTISGDRNKVFVTDTGSDASFNMYFKRDSTAVAPNNGTQRVILAEHNVSTQGSGNPLAPSLAHVTTMAAHYQGTCIDTSVAMAGGNFEANGKVGTAIYATGVYGLAVSAQNGINVGMTGQAENAGFSNIGVYGFAKEGGVGRDRGGYFAVSDLSAFAYAAARAADPIPYNDAAIIADAGKIGAGSATKSLVAVGDALFYGGKVEVPSASADGEAVNLGDIKAKEYETTVTVGAISEETITHSLGTKKILVQVWYNDEDFTSAFAIKRVGDNQITLGNSTGNTYADVEVLIYALS